MGNLANYLYSKGNKLICADISKKALDNVNNISKTYNTRDLKNIEPVDIAICNLVFQHCNDDEVERIINDVNLKDNGFFTFQFAFLRENEEPNNKVKELMRNGTHHFRSLQQIIEIVNKVNEKVKSISNPIHYYGDENFSWYIVQITK